MKTFLIVGCVICFGLVILFKTMSKIGTRGFEIKGGKVYLFSPKNGVPFAYNYKEIEEANASSFKEIKFPFGKDDKHVFVYTEIIEGADLKSFELIGYDQRYSKDKNNVYFLSSAISQDITNFQLLGDGLAKDKQSVFRYGKSIKNADAGSFVNLGNNYSKDKNKVYLAQPNREEPLKIIEQANPETFEIDATDPKKALDGNKIFYKGALLSEAGDSFERIDDYYSMDKTQVYFRMNPLKNSDPKTFKILQDSYSHDAQHVYCRSYLLEDADPDRFQILKEGYAHDTKNLYHRTRKLEGGDIASLEIFGYRWAKDKNQVYLQGYAQEHLDSPSFQSLKAGYVKDEKYVYYFEQPVKGADAGSFRIEGEYPNIIASDRYHQYNGTSAVSSDN